MPIRFECIRSCASEFNERPVPVSNDPYVMEETCAQNARALGSSLWEAAALQRHHAPSVRAAAARLLAAADSRAMPAVLAPASATVRHTHH